MAASVLRSARVISMLTIVSRIAGLVRDMAFSYRFGTGSEMSAFSLAFQIPNLFRRLFGEGALSAAAIPVLTQTLHRDSQEEMNVVVGRLVGLLLAVLTALCVIAEIVIAVLYLIYQSRMDTALALELSSVLMPFMIFICAGALLGGIENVYGRFALPAFMPTVINLVQIAAALGAPYLLPDNTHGQLVFQCVSVLVGGALTLWLQWWGVRRCGVNFKLSLDWRHSAIRRIGKTMLPMVIGLGAVQVNIFMDSMTSRTSPASTVAPGSQRTSTMLPVIGATMRLSPNSSWRAARAAVCGLQRSTSKSNACRPMVATAPPRRRSR